MERNFIKTNSHPSFYSFHVERSRDISDLALKSRDSSTELVLSGVEGLGMTNG